MYKLSEADRKQFRLIASFYGCKVKYAKIDSSGYWDGNTIIVRDEDCSFREIASSFFHELGHFKNWKEDRYPIYHDTKRDWKKHFKHFDRMIRYALNAEIETDRQGKALMKIWLPNLEYTAWYRNTEKCRQFLSGYYMGG